MCSVGYAQKVKNTPKPKSKGKINNQPVLIVQKDTSNTVPTTTLAPELEDIVIIDTNQYTLNASPSALKTKVKYFADDTIVYNAEKQEVYLYGNAKVEYEDLTVTAAFIRIDLNKSIVHAEGKKDSLGYLTGTPIFNQGGQE